MSLSKQLVFPVLQHGFATFAKVDGLPLPKHSYLKTSQTCMSSGGGGVFIRSPAHHESFPTTRRMVELGDIVYTELCSNLLEAYSNRPGGSNQDFDFDISKVDLAFWALSGSYSEVPAIMEELSKRNIKVNPEEDECFLSCPPVLCGWLPYPVSNTTIICNTDGSVFPYNGLSGCSAVARNSKGKILGLRPVPLDPLDPTLLQSKVYFDSSVLLAELEGLACGFDLVVQIFESTGAEYTDALFLTDRLDLVNIIKRYRSLPQELNSRERLLEIMHKLRAKRWKIEHIRSESNPMADYVARRSSKGLGHVADEVKLREDLIDAFGNEEAVCYYRYRSLPRRLGTKGFPKVAWTKKLTS